MTAGSVSNMTITVCTPSELAQVVELVNAAYRGEGGQAGWTSEIGLVDGLRVTIEALRNDFSAASDLSILLLREAGQLLACVRLESATAMNGEPACHIGLLAVRPGMQDRGVGRVLLEHAEAAGRARGAEIARMTVVGVRASLIAWYERRGYRRTGETQPFPYQDARFGHPARPDLDFVVLEKNLGQLPAD